MRVYDESATDDPESSVTKNTPDQKSIDGSNVPAALIKAEANLLRLPLFALGTKGLKTLDGIECRGRVTRDGQTHEFTFSATRNTATLYPGPLARSAHLAFLSVISEAGLPLRGPITWKWRDLCRRMGIVCGGQMVRHLKAAITSTAGLLIQSELALYSKPDGQLIHTHQEALHLYERVTFVGTPQQDGTVADTNYLWLSDWYRNNLNAMFTAPLDYELWRHLDQHSPIASRLYEFLLLNFYSGTPVLRINYETLVQMLPVHAERYRSDAEKQLTGPLSLLSASGIVTNVDWAPSKKGIAQLHFYRGERLASAPLSSALASLGSADFPDAVEVKELRNLKPPEWIIAAEFYRLWTGESGHKPTDKDLAQGQAMLTKYGPAKAKALLPLLVKRLREEWPEAKWFSAAAVFLPDVASAYEQQQRAAERRRQDERREEEEEQKKFAERQTLETQWKPVWDALPDSERDAIRSRVLARMPYLDKTPSILERLCLKELMRQRETQQQQVEE